MKVFNPLQTGTPMGDYSSCRAPLGMDWVVLGFSRRECLEIRDGNFRNAVSHAQNVTSLPELPVAGIDAIAVLSRQVAALFPQSAGNVFAEVAWQDLWTTVLVPWQEPPTRSIRADGLADSFCCSADVFSELLRLLAAESIGCLCFRLLDAVLNGKIAVQTLLVRQLPLGDSSTNSTALRQDAALVMAHRGPKQFLTSALRFATAAARDSNVRIRVGLDLEDVSEYRGMADAFPNVEFYAVEGAPVGPYVIRQGLIDRSREQLIVFHDSDDISCQDRVARQGTEIADREVDVVGSHELRVNEPAGTVEVYRFPLDASAALALPGATEHNDRAQEPLLHPTVTMVRAGFVKAGGFSTNRRIANDTQFMLRAYFSLRMRNVDAFLYIRRRHAHALTVEKNTALGAPLRHFLGSTWGADFEAVKIGKAMLDETSLRPRLKPVPHCLTRLWENE